jgi:hypothetical protein
VHAFLEDTALYENFGTFGAWLNPALGDQARIGYAAEPEQLG